MLKIGDRVVPSKRCDDSLSTDFRDGCGVVEEIPPTGGKKFIDGVEQEEYISIQMFYGQGSLLYYKYELKKAANCEECKARFSCYTSEWW